MAFLCRSLESDHVIPNQLNITKLRILSYNLWKLRLATIVDVERCLHQPAAAGTGSSGRSENAIIDTVI